MKRKQNITIRIADQPPMPLSIDIDDEEVIRTAADNVNQLWTTWSKRFKDKTSSEILAMVAFRFAQLYFMHEAGVESVDSLLQQLEKDLDDKLLEIE